ncbi:MAG: FAD-dependent thymidylate synthase [Candidatus Bathyarchaeia archaeon]
MKVKLMWYTPDPELVCATAALTSSKSYGASQILQKLTKDKARKIVERIISLGHYSVIEHAYFTFSIEDISRAFTHQLVRHRMASYIEQSQRYVKYDDVKHFVVPKTIRENRESKKIYESALTQVFETYRKLLNLGVPKEDARFILPNAAITNILVTMNARGLRHFFNLRCCARAQWEIREVAIDMLKQVKRVAPGLFQNSGPFCVEFGYCREKELKPSLCIIENIRREFAAL